MIFPKAGDMITINSDVEVETDHEGIIRYEAGQEIKVLGYDDLLNHTNADGSFYTPEQYFKEFEAIELHVELGDCYVQNIWDRSGCSDYETPGGETYLSLDEDSGLQIVRHEN